MKFPKFQVPFLGNYIEKRITEGVKERVTAAVNRDEDIGYRRITKEAEDKDLSPLKQDKMLKVSTWLYQRNLTAKRMVNMFKEYVIGKGLNFKAESKKVQDVLNEFWKVNQWNLKISDRIKELGLYGEQVYRTFVNDIDGRVRLGAVDPSAIKEVLQNKENPEELIGITVKKLGDQTPLEIIRPSYDPITDADGKKVPGDGRLIGDTFYFSVNRLIFGTRGLSDILACADWVDQYERALYTMTERSKFLLSFIWDVLITGANEKDLEDRFQELRLAPPKPGSFIVHNEKEIWESKNPDLRGRDFADFFKILRTHLSGGSGFPHHWLFQVGDDANRATSQNMSEPVHKMIEDRQTYVKHMFQQMFQFVIEKKKEKKKLPKDEPEVVVISIPESSVRDSEKVAAMFLQIVQSLTVAVDSRWISDETAGQLVVMVVSQLGLDVSPDEELKKIKGLPEKTQESITIAVKKLQEEMNKK